MFYSNEMKMLCDTFKKGNVQASVLKKDDSALKLIDEIVHPFIKDDLIHGTTVEGFLGEISPNTVYKTKMSVGLFYMYFELPETDGEYILCVGPYIYNKAFTTQKILELAERNGISPQKHKIFEEYISNVPVISETSPLFVMLEVFCERIWGADSFSFVEKNMERPGHIFSVQGADAEDDDGDVFVAMKIIEKRYKYENNLMKAVSLGQTQRAQLMLSGFSEYSFKNRITDITRNVKNYSIIMNTLLRKAAENGGVHPIYLDSVSSAYAVRIEQLTSAAEAFELMKEMLGTYCRLVRKHSIGSYSPNVQKTITMINADLSANLTLSTIAEAHGISPGYLSSVFKKEVGMTVSEYIREKRMNYAEHLLSTTHLQIQTIALHCGIMDLQYFSKIFKKHTGKTPKEYRNSVK